MDKSLSNGTVYIGETTLVGFAYEPRIGSNCPSLSIRTNVTFKLSDYDGKSGKVEVRYVTYDFFGNVQDISTTLIEAEVDYTPPNPVKIVSTTTPHDYITLSKITVDDSFAYLELKLRDRYTINTNGQQCLRATNTGSGRYTLTRIFSLTSNSSRNTTVFADDDS